tara:strand:+ start:1226 stop:1606 length:381 start_codon:yes stop_codon:yes gene_type:complete
MTSDKPKGELSIRVLAMPADTNPAGDIFGGWLLSQMDVAGNILAKRIASGRTVTIAIDSMSFLEPVSVGDTLCCYTHVERIGKTSITIMVEAWATPQYTEESIKVTEGIFTYVAIDENRKPRVIKT